MKLQRKYQPLCFMYYDVFIKRSSGLILIIIFGPSRYKSIVQDCFGCQFTDRSFSTKQAGFFWKLFITFLFLVNNLLSLCKIHETVLKVCPFLKVKKLHFVCYYF